MEGRVMDDEITELEKKVKEKQEIDFFKPKQKEMPVADVAKPIDKNTELMETVFHQAVEHQIKNDEDLQSRVLETAKDYTNTKMDVIKTNVDTEFKEANFNNRKDACESYGFNEKTTPVWATKFMTWGYSVMLAVYLFVATFTVMPVIFLAKKIQVAVKKSWAAIILALVIYLLVTFVPIFTAIIQNR